MTTRPGFLQNITDFFFILITDSVIFSLAYGKTFQRGHQPPFLGRRGKKTEGRRRKTKLIFTNEIYLL